MFLIRIFSCVLFLVSIHNRADAMLGASRAQAFLLDATKFGLLATPKDFTSFLKARIKKSYATGDEREEELKLVLNASAVSDSVSYHINCDIMIGADDCPLGCCAGARVRYFFAKMVEEESARALGKELLWLENNLTERADSYTAQFPKIAAEEMKLQESRELAQATLRLLSSRKQCLLL
jgi:hypothetical protein